MIEPVAGRRRLGIAVAAAVLAAMGIGVGVLLSTRDGDESARTEPGGQAPTTPGPERERRSDVAYSAFVSDSGSYSSVLPTADGWTHDREEVLDGALYRTAVHGPGDTELLIDHTPGEPATFALKAEADCRTLSHPTLAAAEKCVFSGGSLPQCQSTRCTNYLLNASPEGPGFAVLAGGSDRAQAEAVSARIADELRPR